MAAPIDHPKLVHAGESSGNKAGMSSRPPWLDDVSREISNWDQTGTIRRCPVPKRSAPLRAAEFESEEPIHVLIVDDDAMIRRTLSRILLRHGFASAVASNAKEARELLRRNTYELMLVDVSMPGESGLELIQSVIPDNPDMAIVIVSGIGTPDVAQFAFQIGVYGFVVKPFHMNEVCINIANALRRRDLEIETRHQRERLELLVSERTSALEDAIDRLKVAELGVRNSQVETIHRLSKAAEFRDNETARHIERMSRYCELIANQIGLSRQHVELIRMASPLHDIGKIGTPDQILLKPGRLERDEFEIMKQHAQIGYKILNGSGSDLLELAATIAWTHHERVDGAGYPRGLRGEDIPVEGRIAAVADVFDALTSTRVYKAAMSNEKSLQILEEGRGTHFDASILDAFLASLDDALEVQRAFVDG
jgi:putative two-component system response regulator